MNKPSQIKMPNCIEKCVRKQNVMFMHERSQFCPEYFQFMKKLLNCNPMFTHGPQEKLVSICFYLVLSSWSTDALLDFISQILKSLFQSQDMENLAMISTELASKFLFSVGFHTKKTLRWGIFYVSLHV